MKTPSPTADRSSRKTNGAIDPLTIILDNTEEAFTLLDMDLNLVWFNKLAVDIAKATQNVQLFQGMSIFEMARPEEIPAYKDMFQRVLNGAKEQTERRLNLGANKYQIHRNTIKPAYNEEGEVMGVFISSVDITELKKGEEKLIQSEKYFRSIIDNSSDAIVLIDITGQVMYMSKEAERVTGYTLTEMQEIDGNTLIHPDDQAGNAEFFAKLLMSPGTSMSRSHRVKNKGGKYVWLDGIYTNMLQDENVKAIVYSYHDVTEKKTAEEKQSLLASIVDSTDDAIISKDLNSIITSWNKAAEKTFGYTAAEAIGQHIAMLIPQQRLEEETLLKEQVKSGHHVDHFETVRVRKDGKEIDVSLTISPIRDINGNIIGASKISRDITKEKIATEVLNEEREKLKLVIENMNAGVMVADVLGNFTLYNETAEKILGTSVAKRNVVKSQETFGIYYPDKVTLYPESELPMAKAIKGFKTNNVVMYIKNAQLDEGVFISSSGSPMRNTQGKITGGVVVFRDITEQIQVEEQLVNSFKQIAAASEIQASILDALPANIALLDKDGVVMDVNESWIRFGNENNLCSKLYCVGENYLQISECAQGEDREVGLKMAKGIRGVINGTLPYFELEYPCYSPTEESWYRAEVAPLMRKNRTGAVVMHINITDRKKIENEIQQLNTSLERKVEERTEELESFAYSVSHDLRAPLRIINGFSHILLKDYNDKLDENGNRVIGHINDNAKRMDALIEDLLKLSRLGKEDLKEKSTDMYAMALNIVEEIKLANPALVVPEIIINGMPQAWVDVGLIKQVWVNLISNAIKYSGKNINPKVEIGCTKMEGKDVYFVKDNGVGFDMKYANKLFKVFQRLHSSEEFEGTGVGLVIVSRIIKRHNGKIWAEGELGKGATFYFSL